jgi:MFS family permease
MSSTPDPSTDEHSIGEPLMGEPSMAELYRQLSLSVYLPSFLMSMLQGSVLLMIPLFALELGANAGVAALIFSLRGLGNIVSDIPAGISASRLGDKFTMLIGVGIMALTSFGASLASSPVELSASAFAFGAGMSVWLLGRLTHIAESIPVMHRGRAIATMAGIQRLGGFLGPVLSGIAALQFGFSAVFMTVGLLALLAFISVWVFTPGNRRAPALEEAKLLQIIPGIIRTHRNVFLTAGLAMLLLTMLRASRQLMIPLWGEFIGLDTAQIGYIMGAAAMVDMCMFPAAGYILDSWGRKPAAIACLFFLAAGLTLVPFTASSLGLIGAAMVVGLGNGLGSGINMTLGADFSPVKGRGEFLGVWRLIGDTGSFGGPILMGAIAQAFLLSSAFALAAVIGLMGIALIHFGVRETRHQN